MSKSLGSDIKSRDSEELLVFEFDHESFDKGSEDDQSAVVEPMTVIAAIQVGIAVISAFSSKPQSGLGAMMLYQQRMLQHISSQINELYIKVYEIERLVEDLPEEIERLIDLKLDQEKVEVVNGAIQSYKEEIIDALSLDPTVIDNSAWLGLLSDILNRIISGTSQLRVSSNGYSPEACILIPMALAVEIGGKTLLNYPNSVLVTTLRKYDTWADSVLDQGNARSTAAIISRMKYKHDKIVTDLLRTNSLAQKYNFGEYKLSGNQGGEKHHGLVECGVIFSDINVTEPRDRDGGFVIPSYWDYSGHSRYLQSGFIRCKLDSRTNAKLIEYASSGRVVNGTSYLLPRSGEYWYFRIKPEFNSNEEIRKHIDETNDVWRKAEREAEELGLAVANMNYCRARVSQCLDAISVAENVKRRINEYKNFF